MKNSERYFGKYERIFVSNNKTYEPKLKIKLLSENATLPTRAYPTDSGLDLYTAEAITLHQYTTNIIPTDIAIQLPPNTEAQVRPRSGVTSRTPLRVQLGTIDNSYTGNIGIIVDNIGDKTIELPKGYKLAQLVVAPVIYPDIELVDELNNTDRSENGFGSSGV